MFRRKTDGHQRAAALGVFQRQRAAVHFHDLVAHRKANARAPDAGAALVEFFLHQRQLVLRNAGAKVPDIDDHIFAVVGHGCLNTLARAAMLGGVVQKIQEHLPHPLGVAGNFRNVLVVVQIDQLNAVLCQTAAVHIHRVLEFTPDVRHFHSQRHAAVLHPGEVQQIHDHFRQALGLAGNDLHALPGVVVQVVSRKQRLAPSVDNGQRGAQLMGQLGDELRLHFFVLGNFRGHFIDGVRQIADLILEGRLNLDAVAAGGDSLGFFRDLRHRI